MEYPEETHDKNQNHFLAPTKETIPIKRFHSGRSEIKKRNQEISRSSTRTCKNNQESIYKKLLSKYEYKKNHASSSNLRYNCRSV